MPNGTARQDSDYEATAGRFSLDHSLGALRVSLSAGLNAAHLGAPGPITFPTLSARQNSLDEDAELTLRRDTARAGTVLEISGTEQQIAFWCDPIGDPGTSSGGCFQPLTATSTEGRAGFDLRNIKDVRHQRKQMFARAVDAP